MPGDDEELLLRSGHFPKSCQFLPDDLLAAGGLLDFRGDHPDPDGNESDGHDDGNMERRR
jgi:hypothetical protein